MKRCIIVVCLLAAGCGTSDEAAPAANDTARITNQIAQQAKEIQAQADNGAAAIEQALENEGAAIFENRAQLLNESGNATAATTGNRTR